MSTEEMAFLLAVVLLRLSNGTICITDDEIESMKDTELHMEYENGTLTVRVLDA